uniref:solute carrier family 22 member 5-like n=1 Tax=Bombus vancouverensis nearcticus TaxID=2705178 RepID=UPI0014394DE1|nr:solute carrier family 22 member 5-like [Bombus vancouverensis nearcticus]
MGFLAGVATAFTGSFWQFTLCRFFVGFAFDNCFTMMYILVLEYVGPKWRTFVANMSIAIFFTFATCILPWIAYYLADWRMTCIVTSVPLVLAVGTPWLIPESARWLVSQGQIDRAIKILGKFERINGTKVPDDTYRRFRIKHLETAQSMNRSWQY